MADVLSWLSGNWLTLITMMLAVVGGASTIVAAIAPLTKTNLDNKILGVLGKIHSFLSKIALNPPVQPPSDEG